ncbi:MAG TPA: methyltransferase domain-containing protein [Isosphaeraceae bacterium]|nr:methyltransferase domain-containing protein [Isosphaeraceae bacterium]
MTAILPTNEVAYFERLAEVESAHWWSRGMWRIASYWLARALRGKRGLSALDVGCGTGFTAARLASRLEIGEVIGLDPSREALMQARRHGCHWVRGSALDLPFASESIDIVTCFDVFQHLLDGADATAASEIRRVLRPGGVALLRANARSWLPEGARAGKQFRLAELTAVIEKAGLNVRRASYANCLPAFAQELRDRANARLRPRVVRPSNHSGLRITVPGRLVNRMMGGVASAEALLAGPGGCALPFGHSTLVLAERVAAARPGQSETAVRTES